MLQSLCEAGAAIAETQILFLHVEKITGNQHNAGFGNEAIAEF